MNEFIERLGWVLVHSLWQFALVALLAGVARRAMRRSSSAARYGALVVAMTVMVVVPLATWLISSSDARDQGSGLQISKLANEDHHATSEAQSLILKFEDPTPDRARCPKTQATSPAAQQPSRLLPRHGRRTEPPKSSAASRARSLQPATPRARTATANAPTPNRVAQ